MSFSLLGYKELIEFMVWPETFFKFLLFYNKRKDYPRAFENIETLLLSIDGQKS